MPLGSQLAALFCKSFARLAPPYLNDRQFQVPPRDDIVVNAFVKESRSLAIRRLGPCGTICER